MTDDFASYYGASINRQRSLLPDLPDELDPLTARLEHLIIILDTLGLEAFVTPPSRGRGRPPDDRPTMRSFVAKAVLNLPTTAALLERLQIDRALRRVCGWERRSERPRSEATFSRAFAEFATRNLPERVHEQLIRHHLASAPAPGGSRRSPRRGCLAPPRQRQVVVRFDQVRFQLQGPAIAGDRFVQPAQVLPHVARIDVRRGIVRLQPQGPAVAGDGRLRFARLVGDQTEKVPSAGMAGPPGENPPAESARQPAIGRPDGAGPPPQMLRESLP